MTDSILIPPYGGSLVDLLPIEEEARELRAAASHLPSLQISDRSQCDLELIASGGFSPLDRFMSKDDHERVVAEMRLADGTLFPMPIGLPVNADQLPQLDRQVALRNANNDLLAILTVEEIYPWDHAEVAQSVFGTLDLRHPIVAEMQRWGKHNVSGSLRMVAMPRHYDSPDLRMTPAEVRSRLEALGKGNVVAFQTRNPIHRAHEEVTRRAAERIGGTLLLHPVVGLTKPGDVDYFTRVRTYRVLASNYYDRDRTLLSLLPLAMRMGGPREALWHAIIRRNFGANHLVIGRDHASPGVDSTGKPFYGPYDAQELVEHHSAEIGVKPVPFQELVYLPDEDRYEESDKIPPGAKTASISGTQVRDHYLNAGKPLPAWFTRPEVAEILGEAYPPRHRQGVCIWFTGLSGAGKTTTAEILMTLLLEHGRQVTMLDGDVVRTHLSRGLGFSREDRDANIRRIGFVAAEVVRHGGTVICAAVSPYRGTREDVRRMIGADQFLEVFVDTPLSVCEDRDIKGMYAKARRGEIKEFTGISDPYEEPLDAEFTLDTVGSTAEQNARRILAALLEKGLVRA